MQFQHPQQGSKPPPTQVDPRFQKLLTLLTLQKQARHKDKIAELGFLMVNQTFNLMQYRHCIFWRWDGQHVTVEAASGLMHIDPHGPYAQWLQKVIGKILLEKGAALAANIIMQQGDESYAKSLILTSEDCDPAEAEQWKEWTSPKTLLLAMKGPDGRIGYGLWIDREEAFTDTDMAFVEDLADGYAHVLQRLDVRESTGIFSAKSMKQLFNLKKSNALRIILLIFLISLCPVRMSVTAPAEVVAKSPYVISVPFDGVIEKVEVQPNHEVKKGDLLLKMESSALTSKTEITAQELETARIAYTKTEREALGDPSKLTDINVLRAQIRAKEVELQYAEDLLSKTEIRAPEDGVVIFSDPNELRGRPSRTGEQVMLLARPEDSELMIRIPVDAMIEIDEREPAKFYLNVSPIGSHSAMIDSIGYQVSPDADGLLTYKVRALFEEGGQEKPRVGWTGTAKVYGARTILLFNVLRRPLVSLRHKLSL